MASPARMMFYFFTAAFFLPETKDETLEDDGCDRAKRFLHRFGHRLASV